MYLGAQHGSQQQPVLVKMSLESWGSKRAVALPGLKCDGLAPQSAIVPGGTLVAAACTNSVALIDSTEDQVVAQIPAGASNGCNAVAWQSAHQLWVSDKSGVRLWDLRQASQPLAEHTTDETPVHTLCSAGSGVIAGTMKGSYAIALGPTDTTLGLTCKGFPREQSSGGCVSVATTGNSTTAQGMHVVTSFRQGACSYGSPALAQAQAHHSIGCLAAQGGARQRDWYGGEQLRGFQCHQTATKCAALQLPRGVVFCGGDESGAGCVKVWQWGHLAERGLLRPRLAGSLGAHAGGKAAAHVRQVCAGAGDQGSWLVAALRTRPQSTAEPSLVLHRVTAH